MTPLFTRVDPFDIQACCYKDTLDWILPELYAKPSVHGNVNADSVSYDVALIGGVDPAAHATQVSS